MTDILWYLYHIRIKWQSRKSIWQILKLLEIHLPNEPQTIILWPRFLLAKPIRLSLLSGIEVISQTIVVHNLNQLKN